MHAGVVSIEEGFNYRDVNRFSENAFPQLLNPRNRAIAEGRRRWFTCP
jgi:hypothetical protein